MNTPTKTVSVPNDDQVSPANQALFDNLKRGLGFVPNLYATFAHSNTALVTFRALQSAKSLLSPKAREGINLVVSQINSCAYCLAAHTALGQRVGFAPGQIIEIRLGGVDGMAGAWARPQAPPKPSGCSSPSSAC